MVAIAFPQRRFTVTKHCGNKDRRSCLRRSRPSVAQFNGDRRQATEKATLPLLEGPSEPKILCCDFTHTGYDTVGNRTVMADSTGRYTNVYDAVGQTTAAALPNSKRITNTLDAVGNRRTTNSANGRTTSTYDAANQLTSQINGNAKRTSLTYDDAGRRTQQKATDGSRTSWTYDAASNLTKVQDKKADSSTISSFDYRTDNVGNRIGATLASGASAYANTFAYDTVGNRLVLNESGTRTTTVYDNANQIKYSTAAAGRTTYTFDANGNQQIVREPAGARTTTTWNYENQPTLFRMPDGSRVTMTYNANNRRVKRK